MGAEVGEGTGRAGGDPGKARPVPGLGTEAGAGLTAGRPPGAGSACLTEQL